MADDRQLASPDDTKDSGVGNWYLGRAMCQPFCVGFSFVRAVFLRISMVQDRYSFCYLYLSEMILSRALFPLLRFFRRPCPRPIRSAC